jgi:hypothetical protein
MASAQSTKIRFLALLLKKPEGKEMPSGIQALLNLDVTSTNTDVQTEGVLVEDSSQAKIILKRRDPDVLFLRASALISLENVIQEALSPERTTICVGGLGRLDEPEQREEELQWLESHLKAFRILTTRNKEVTMAFGLHKGLSVEAGALITSFASDNKNRSVKDTHWEMNVPAEVHVFERGDHAHRVIKPADLLWVLSPAAGDKTCVTKSVEETPK